jgi:hypothetical protein
MDQHEKDMRLAKHRAREQERQQRIEAARARRALTLTQAEIDAKPAGFVL